MVHLSFRNLAIGQLRLRFVQTLLGSIRLDVDRFRPASFAIRQGQSARGRSEAKTGQPREVGREAGAVFHRRGRAIGDSILRKIFLTSQSDP